jgi:peptide/nickel transport system substrate-binding protein
MPWKTSRQSRRRILAAGVTSITGLAAIGLAACGGDDGAPKQGSPSAADAPVGTAAVAQRRGGTIRLHGSTGDTNDLHQSNNATNQKAAQWSIDQLMTYDEPTPGDIKVAPMLAESIEQPDDQTYVYHLRKGVKFHNVAPVNGRELVGEDVVFSFKRMATSDPKFARRGWFAPVSAMDAADASTVRIKTKEPNATLSYLLASPWSGIISKEQVSRDGDVLKSYIGTGPYINQRADLNSEFTYARNPDFWIKDAAYFDTVNLVNLTDPTAWQSAFRAGQVQVIQDTGLSADIIDNFGKQNPNARLYKFPYGGVGIVAMNTRRAPFGDKRVRQAIAAACDIPGWIAAIEGGKGVPTGPIAPYFTQWGLPKDKLKYGKQKQDYGQAKQLLAAAGVNPQSISFKATTISTSPAWVAMAVQLQSDLKALGITVQIDPVAGADYTTRLAVTFDYDTLTGYDFSLDDPDRLVEVYSSTGSRNNTGYSTPELDLLLIKQRQTLDQKARQQIAYQIQQILEDDVPMFYTYIPDAFAFTQGLANWRPTAVTANDIRWNARYASLSA